jgi:transposase-like protein
MKEKFDFEQYKKQAVEDLLSGRKEIGGPDGVLAPLLKQFLEAALEAEIENHVQESKAKGEDNRRNGKSTKEVRSLSGGTFELTTPRDRDSSFDPVIVPKRQTFLGTDLERKVLLMYAHGMSYESISQELYQIYGIEASPAFISEVTDKVIPVMEAWRRRPLEAVYCLVFLDAMHFRVRGESNTVESRMLYIAYGIRNTGHKEVLGMYLAPGEGAKFWLSVMSDLQQRGVEDILIASVDGLKGFAEAITSVFPKTAVQGCIVHQIRHSRKFVSDKDVRAFMADLKPVYKAIDEAEARQNLEVLDAKWGKKYSPVIKSWQDNWERLSTFYQYPAAIRKIMYTTNPIEGLNRQIRKITKTKGAFASETALLKLVYLIIEDKTLKWTNTIPNWGEIAGQLHILFGERARITLSGA